jgi:transcription initiation factor IIE alpha subunit
MTTTEPTCPKCGHKLLFSEAVEEVKERRKEVLGLEDDLYRRHA